MSKKNEYSNEVRTWTNENVWLSSRFTCFLSSRRTITVQDDQNKRIFPSFDVCQVQKKKNHLSPAVLLPANTTFAKKKNLKKNLSVVHAGFSTISNKFSCLLMLHPVAPGLHYSVFGHILSFLFFFNFSDQCCFQEKAGKIFWGHECGTRWRLFLRGCLSQWPCCSQ